MVPDLTTPSACSVTPITLAGRCTAPGRRCGVRCRPRRSDRPRPGHGPGQHARRVQPVRGADLRRVRRLFNVTIDGFTNPTSNTDIFLTYSDDDGRTWSTRSRSTTIHPSRTASPGRTTTSIPTTRSTGTSQYQPEIAVDPTTGTAGPVLARRPQRPREHPGGDLHHHQHRRRQHLQRPGLRQPPATAIDAITGQEDVLGPEGDNATAADNSR